jgi:hypothetical protein
LRSFPTMTRTYRFDCEPLLRLLAATAEHGG